MYQISYFDSDVLIQIMISDTYFKCILRKRNCYTLNPSYLGKVSFATVTTSVNSLQPTLWCVITLCVCLNSLCDKDVPFRDFVALSVVVIVALPRAAWGGGRVSRTRRLATEPPQYTHTHTHPRGVPLANFSKGPGYA